MNGSEKPDNRCAKHIHNEQPRVLWIELSSKCPFDCVFCSRRLRHGAGVHMDIALFRRIMAGLDAPEIIRLNYSGESIHHPHLIEAIGLAASTGANTELVTALASLPDRLIAPLARSGLDRLTVSLHTLDVQQFGDIYRHSSIGALRQKLVALATECRQMGSRLKIDLAAVAMRRNLLQLPRIAAFAEEIGATGLAIHPVIRRDPIEETFPEELDGERLRPEFLAELNAVIGSIRRQHPALPLSVSTPEVEEPSALGSRPTPFTGPLPGGARIHSCDQSPWETVHILANGHVVTCEVRDHINMGTIAADPSGESLGQIWSGTAYSNFRTGFRAGVIHECLTCPYKTAYRPSEPVSVIDASAGMHAQLGHGWHSPDGSGLLWAKRRATMELARTSNADVLHVHGVIPAFAGSVRLFCADLAMGPSAALGRTDTEQSWIDVYLPLAAGAAGLIALTIEADRSVVPAKLGHGADVRELGFGLKRIALRKSPL